MIKNENNKEISIEYLYYLMNDLGLLNKDSLEQIENSKNK